jgi:hypothetical protein
VRTRITVVFAALIAAATLVALPAPVGSRAPSPAATLEPDAFRPMAVAQPLEVDTGMPTLPDPAWASDANVRPDTALAEPGGIVYPSRRPRVDQPAAPVRYVTKSVWRWDPEASFYGPGFYGNRTACGLAYTKTIVGVAHRSLPCGTLVQFRNPANGRVVTAPVIDRGPYVAGRIRDLSGGLCIKLDHCYTGPIEWRFVRRG